MAVVRVWAAALHLLPFLLAVAAAADDATGGPDDVNASVVREASDAERRARVAVDLLAARVEDMRQFGGSDERVWEAAETIEQYVNKTYAGKWAIADGAYRDKLAAYARFRDRQANRTDLVGMDEARRVRRQAGRLSDAVQDAIEHLGHLGKKATKAMHKWCKRLRKHVEASIGDEVSAARQEADRWQAAADAAQQTGSADTQGASWPPARQEAAALQRRADESGAELARLTGDHLDKVKKQVKEKAGEVSESLSQEQDHRQQELEAVELGMRQVESEQNKQAVKVAMQAADASRRTAEKAVESIRAYADQCCGSSHPKRNADRAAGEIVWAVMQNFSDQQWQADQNFEQKMAAFKQRAAQLQQQGSHHHHDQQLKELRSEAQAAADRLQDLQEDEFKAMWRKMGNEERQAMLHVRSLEDAAMRASRSWLQAGDVVLEAQQIAQVQEEDYERHYSQVEDQSERLSAEAESVAEELLGSVERRYGVIQRMLEKRMDKLAQNMSDRWSLLEKPQSRVLQEHFTVMAATPWSGELLQLGVVAAAVLAAPLLVGLLALAWIPRRRLLRCRRGGLDLRTGLLDV